MNTTTKPLTTISMNTSDTDLKYLYLSSASDQGLVTIMIFKRSFPPGRPADPAEYQELIEINITPGDILDPKNPIFTGAISGLQSSSQNVMIFYLDKALLNRYSDRFSAVFQTPSTANKTVFFFQNVDTEIFSVLANWLPSARIIDHNHERLSFTNLAKLWTMAERFQIRSLQNNVVKEIWKIMDAQKGGFQADNYLELLESGVDNLRAFALEHLIRSKDLFGEIIEMSRGLGPEETEQMKFAIEKARVQMEARGVVDLEDRDSGVKTCRPWHRAPWYKIYFV